MLLDIPKNNSLILSMVSEHIRINYIVMVFVKNVGDLNLSEGRCLDYIWVL